MKIRNCETCQNNKNHSCLKVITCFAPLWWDYQPKSAKLLGETVLTSEKLLAIRFALACEPGYGDVGDWKVDEVAKRAYKEGSLDTRSEIAKVLKLK